MTDSIITRLEGLTGPDRDIDIELAPLVGIRVVDEGHPLGRCYYDKNGHGVPLPAFTASIDAALTLVPEGWALLLAIAPHKTICDVHEKPLGEVGRWPGHAEAPTPAIAVCLASLRAQGIE